MKLRTRLFVTCVLLSIPIVTGFTLYSVWSRQRALVEATYETTVERMEARGRERCEEAPEAFGRRVGARPRRGPRRRAGAARRARFGRIWGIYDDAYAPMNEQTPPLPAPLRAPLAEGEPTAAVFEDDRARIAMRMPWDGACAVVVIERPVDSEQVRASTARTAILVAAVILLTALGALLALFPVVRRIRRLEESVEAQATTGYERDVVVEGGDEVADLARAFNHAGGQIRDQIQKLEARDEALTEFLQSTTHDVMIPLTVLQGHLSDLRKRMPEDEKVRGAMEESHYIAALLRNLSAAARLDAGEPMIARLDVDLAEVVERVVARHQPIAKARGVQLNHSVPERPVPIHGDSTLLEQMIGNLISNAIRYNQAGGHVAVILEGGFTLTVKDDGPGIPTEELERVSERRFRGGAARTRRPTGLGLGLHIVRDVAEKHGFELRFESPDDGGLTVVISGAR